MKKKTESRPGESFRPPLLYPETPPRWAMGNILDQAAQHELDVINIPIERAIRSPSLIGGHILEDE